MQIILIEKSDENFEAAKNLKEFELYSSCIHCAYYSSFELVLHILFNIYSESEELNFEEKLISHNVRINSIRQKLYKKVEDKKEVIDFSNKIRDLKLLRKKADYEQIKIFNEDSKKAIRFASYINKTLSNIFL